MAGIFESLNKRVSSVSAEASLVKSRLDSGDAKTLREIVPLTTKFKDIKSDVEKEITTLQQSQDLSSKVASVNHSAVSNVIFYANEVIHGIQTLNNLKNLVNTYTSISTSIIGLQKNISTDISVFDSISGKIKNEQSEFKNQINNAISLSNTHINIANIINTEAFKSLTTSANTQLSAINTQLANPNINASQKQELLFLQAKLQTKIQLLKV